MRFTDLKKNLQENILPCYILKGDDSFLQKNALSQIQSKVVGDNTINMLSFSTDEIDVRKFIDYMNMMGFFNEKKLAVLREIEGKNSKELITALKQYLKNPNTQTVLVIITVNKSDYFKDIINLCELVDCNRLEVTVLKKWITKKCESLNSKIEPDAINRLIEVTNGYLSKIDLELDKIIAYSGGNIEISHIDLLCTQDLEYNIFELTECIAQKNKKRAISIAEDLLSNYKTATGVLPLIYNHFRRLFYVSVSSLNNYELASMLEVKEYAVNKYKQQAVKFKPVQLKSIVEECAELDFKLKNQIINTNNAIFGLIFKIIQ